jgi:hypothetical protein
MVESGPESNDCSSGAFWLLLSGVYLALRDLLGGNPKLQMEVLT